MPQCVLCAMAAMCCGGEDGSWFAKSVQMNMFLYDACGRENIKPAAQEILNTCKNTMRIK